MGVALVLRAALLLVLGLLLGACGSGGPGGSGAPGGTTGVSPSGPAGQGTVTVTATPTTSSASTDGFSTTVAASSLEMFSSPSGNILCGIGVEGGREWARCDIGEKDWTSPPQPDDCGFDWGNSLDMDSGGAQFACVSDAVGDPGRPLAYGEALQVGQLVCRSEESGMTCEHLDTGHGFSLSRAIFTLF